MSSHDQKLESDQEISDQDENSGLIKLKKCKDPWIATNID